MEAHFRHQERVAAANATAAYHHQLQLLRNASLANSTLPASSAVGLTLADVRVLNASADDDIRNHSTGHNASQSRQSNASGLHVHLHGGPGDAHGNRTTTSQSATMAASSTTDNTFGLNLTLPPTRSPEDWELLKNETLAAAAFNASRNHNISIVPVVRMGWLPELTVREADDIAQGHKARSDAAKKAAV